MIFLKKWGFWKSKDFLVSNWVYIFTVFKYSVKGCDFKKDKLELFNTDNSTVITPLTPKFSDHPNSEA